MSASFPLGEGCIARSSDLRTAAVLHGESQRRDALLGLLLISVVCWMTWFFAAYQHNASPGFPWPVPIILATGIPLLRMLMGGVSMIDEMQLSLERQHHRALESPKQLQASDRRLRMPSPDERRLPRPNRLVGRCGLRLARWAVPATSSLDGQTRAMMRSGSCRSQCRPPAGRDWLRVIGALG